MRELVLIGEVAIAGIERFGQQEQPADQVTVLGKFDGVTELVAVALRVIGLHVLDFVA